MNYAAVRYRAIEKISSPILTAMARMNMARAAAMFIGAHMETEQRAEGANPVNIVYLPKAGHTEDIMACFKGYERYGILTLDRKLVKAVFAAFLPKTMDDNNYKTADAKANAAKLRLRAFWVEVLKYLRPSLNFHALFTGNFSYASEQELAAACTESGLPFIALHKECMKTPGLRPFYVDVYKTRKIPFQGTAICNYNEMETGIQTEAGVFDPDRIKIVGMPRLSRVHWRREDLVRAGKKADAPTILFFSFNSKAGLPVLGRKIPGSYETLQAGLEKLNVEKASKACHHALVNLARENPHIKVIIKTKGDQNAKRFMTRLFGENPDFPPNLHLAEGGDLLDMLSQATVVASFNSTTLFEALALDKPVVVPWFYEITDPALKPYILDMDDAVLYAHSEEEFCSMLKDLAVRSHEEGRELPQTSQRLLEKWCGNPDGRTGDRIRRVLDSLLSESD
ncbi:hypothetical protein Dalk_1665 [Desulfatibacillum aliphaticivorans]|uniref:Uncharacterized protein n=1 Tax=Desulfatibacillum aliphaticivorans TaxID=218208 RepID=B8FAR7_DESAL|nr:hypothetical protein [Desulfatibacillum aliphaticivorans]ACL03363.1 hypothetical protein Dalk_1665 [Desulfatibacillum aliphaticivorans]